MAGPEPQSPRALSPAVRAALGVYGLAWGAALPLLRRNARLAEGWTRRTLEAGPPPKADLWIQAASGGEAYLAWELVRRLPEVCPAPVPLRVFASTFTSQGLGVLERARADLAGRLELLPAYVPFDRPALMERALAAISPRAVLLLETEIWPGLLAACRKAGVPALLVNARMTEKSRRGYLRLPGLWRGLAPARVLAVSADDAARFAQVFPGAHIGRMPNIKFDRLAFAPPPPGAELAALLPPDAPFLVLGSVRRQEEAQALELIRGLLGRLPGVVLGLFPRHMNRVDAWAGLLAKAGVPFVRRSGLAAGRPARPGAVLLWDSFGELAAAFGLARACFVGGGLADLGGQNFLEPLAHGLTPVIGPSWSNFAWVGEELFAAGLVRKANAVAGVLAELCALAENPPDKDAVRRAAEAYAAARRGGALAACQAVAERLNCG